MKKIIFLTVLALFAITNSFAQSEKEKDSLLFLIKYAEGIEKVELSKTYFNAYYKEEPGTVVKMIDELLVEPSLNRLDSAELFYLRTRSSYYDNDFKGYKESRTKSIELLQEYKGEKNGYYNYLMYNQEKINAIQSVHMGSPSDALQSFLLALQYAEKSNRLDIIRVANMDVGSYYVKEKEFAKALGYLNKCQEFAETHDGVSEDYLDNLNSELATTYIGLGDLEKSKFYIDKMPKETNSFSNLITKVNYYSKNGQSIKALALIDTAEVHSNNFKGKPRHWLPFLQMLKADNLFLLKKFDEAEKNWLDCRISFLQQEDADNLKYVSDRLYKYYKGRGYFEKALIFHEENKSISDSMLYKNHNAVIKGIQDSNDLNLQKQENEKLKTQDEINNLVIQRQRLLGGLGLLLLGLLAAFGFVYFKSSRTKRKLNNELIQVNTSLETKNQEIKSRIDELSYISKNLPAGIGRLNHNHKLIFHNKQMVNRLFDEANIEQRNIFELLGYQKEDQRIFEDDLRTYGKLAFTWFPEHKNEVYQIQILQTGKIKGSEEYLIVVQDVTRLKENEKKKITAVESELKKMEDSALLINIEKEALNESLEVKNKELISKMMQISKRDTEIKEILDSLKNLYKESSSASKLKLTKIINKVNSTLDVEDGWIIFNTYFKEIHPNFLSELRNKSDNLTNNEVRHCTFIKLGLTNREVSEMLNISSKSVEVARYRIKKKMNLDKEQSLNLFIDSIS